MEDSGDGGGRREKSEKGIHPTNIIQTERPGRGQRVEGRGGREEIRTHQGSELEALHTVIDQEVFIRTEILEALLHVLESLSSDTAVPDSDRRSSRECCSSLFHEIASREHHTRVVHLGIPCSLHDGKFPIRRHCLMTVQHVESRDPYIRLDNEGQKGKRKKEKE